MERTQSPPLCHTASTAASSDKIASLTCPEPSCRRVFSRSDHVQRHYVSAHDGSRPFACTMCDKRFARRDLLRRHLANRAVHGLRDPEAASKSKRVLKACRRCAVKKLKCDGEWPCSRCRKPGHECIYDKSTPKQNPPPPPSSTIVVGTPPGLKISPPPPSNLVERPYASPLSLQSVTQQAGALDSEQAEPGACGQTYADDLIDDPLLDPTLYAELATGGPYLELGICTESDVPWIEELHLDRAKMEAIMRDAIATQSEDAGDSDDSQIQIQDTFEQSLWQWNPNQSEYLDQEDTPSPAETQFPSRTRAVRSFRYFDSAMRDKLLAVIVQTMPPDNRTDRHIPTLPSASMLDDLVHFSVLQQSFSIDSWVDTRAESTESAKFLMHCVLAANGAVHSSVKAVKRFGYALHEVIRKHMTDLWRSDANRTRDLSLIRSQIYNTGIGIWSGYNRVMVISEAFLPQAMTMVRRSGGFESNIPSPVRVSTELSGHDLKQQWESFNRQETSKRTMFHMFIEQAQASMTFHMPPNLSITEMKIPLPFRRDTWDSETPETWKAQWLDMIAKHGEVMTRLPTLFECIADISKLVRVRDVIDFPMAAHAVLMGYWVLIHQQQELGALSKIAVLSLTDDGSLLQPNREAVDSLLENFQTNVLDVLPEGTSARTFLQSHFAVLSIQHCARLSVLQNFAGRFGPAASAASRPELVEWFNSPSSRSACRWAAVVLRAADEMPRGSLRDFPAIAVYHASLVLWTYGIFERCPRLCGLTGTEMSEDRDTAPVILDGSFGDGDDDNGGRQQAFIQRNQGTAHIVVRPYDMSTPPGSAVQSIPLRDPVAVMDTCRAVYESNHRSIGQSLCAPTLVENLIRLVSDLGKIARRRIGDQEASGLR